MIESIIGVICLSFFGILFFVGVIETRKEVKETWIKNRFYSNNPKNDYTKKLNK